MQLSHALEPMGTPSFLRASIHCSSSISHAPGKRLTKPSGTRWMRLNELLTTASRYTAHEVNLRQLPAMRDLRIDDLLRFVHLRGERLLARDGIAGSDALQDQVFVRSILGSCGRGIHARVLDLLLPVVEHLRAALCGNPLQPADVSVHQGRYVHAVDPGVRIFGVVYAYICRADDADHCLPYSFRRPATVPEVLPGGLRSL